MTLVLHGPDWTYYFNVMLDLPPRWLRPLGGVFLFSHRMDEGQPHHTYLLVGHTSDLSKPLVPERQQCLRLHGSNCISLLLEEDEDRRAEIVADLLKVNSFPCNLEWVPTQSLASAQN